MAAVLGQQTELAQLESEIAALLQNHFGDGLVYLPKNQSEAVYAKALAEGYFDKEGYLSRKGRVLLARYQYR